MEFLIIDKDPTLLETAANTLERLGCRTHTARNIKQADRILDKEKIRVVLVDEQLGEQDGIRYLDAIHQRSNPPSYTVVTSKTPNIDSAIRAVKKEAFHYLQKPLDYQKLESLLAELRRDETQISERVNDSNEDSPQAPKPKLMFDSKNPEMQETLSIAMKAASSDAGILILGPSGTGKTVLAKKIHMASPRANESFVTLSCPSLSKELLESELFGYVKGAFTGAAHDRWGKVNVADKGTLFLDEIGELPKEIQPKLLRLLQEREYERLGDTQTFKSDIRIISATNRDIIREVKEEKFREDLFYRLNVITIDMPPLHKRPEDILDLAANFLNYFKEKQGREDLSFQEEVERAFLKYSWPGNLREMANVIERLVILAPTSKITFEDLPEVFKTNENTKVQIGAPLPLEEVETEHIRKVIEKSETFEEASDILEIDSATLYRKRKKMEL